MSLLIKKHYPKQWWSLSFALVLALLGFIVGIFAPLLTLEKLIFLEHTVSIVSGLGQMWQQQQYLLFVLIGGFSLILPFAKIMVLFRLLSVQVKQRPMLTLVVKWVHLYGKWSMLDVFVVALLVVTVKLEAIATVEAHYGLVAFAGSVLLTMLVTSRLLTLSDQVLEK